MPLEGYHCQARNALLLEKMLCMGIISSCVRSSKTQLCSLLRQLVKKNAFLFTFALLQLFLLFFYIHHQSMVIKLSYQKQKYEKKKLELAHKKQDLTHALHAQHNLADIKAFALKAHMRKITLDQVRTVPHEHAA